MGAERSERRLDVVFVGDSAAFRLVDRSQFIRRCVISANAVFRLDLQRNFGKFLLPLGRRSFSGCNRQ